MSELVVPDIAESTTMFFFSFAISWQTFFIRAGVPTEVPPNFKTFMSCSLVLLFLVVRCLRGVVIFTHFV